MNATLRLLILDKKGIHQRIQAAIEEAGGRIQHSRLKQEMRGLSETEIGIAFESDLFLSKIVTSVAKVPGVALLKDPSLGDGKPPAS